MLFVTGILFQSNSQYLNTALRKICFYVLFIQYENALNFVASFFESTAVISKEANWIPFRKPVSAISRSSVSAYLVSV